MKCAMPTAVLLMPRSRPSAAAAAVHIAKLNAYSNCSRFRHAVCSHASSIGTSECLRCVCAHEIPNPVHTAHWCNGEFASRLSRVKMRAILTKCKCRDAEAANTHTNTHAITAVLLCLKMHSSSSSFFFVFGFVLCVSQKKQKYSVQALLQSAYICTTVSAAAATMTPSERREKNECISH